MRNYADAGFDAAAITPKSAPERPRIAGIDAGRFVCFWAVVLIHTLVTPAERGLTSEALLAQFSHVAVPFFFIAAGYFLRVPEGAPWAGAWRLARRLGPIYLVWLLFYVPVLDGGPWRLESARGFAKALLTGYPVYHLWFLPALFCSSAVYLVLRPRLGWRALFGLATASYVFALLMGPLRPLIPILPQLPFGPRNGPFTGFLFVLLGAWAAARRPRADVGAALLILGAGAGLHVAENAALFAAGVAPPNGVDFTLGTVAMGWGAFRLALSIPETPVARALARPGPLVLGLYLLHPLWILLLQHLLRPATFAERLAQAAATIIATTASVMLLVRVPPARMLLV